MQAAYILAAKIHVLPSRSNIANRRISCGHASFGKVSDLTHSINWDRYLVSPRLVTVFGAYEDGTKWTHHSSHCNLT